MSNDIVGIKLRLRLLDDEQLHSREWRVRLRLEDDDPSIPTMQ